MGPYYDEAQPKHSAFAWLSRYFFHEVISSIEKKK